jgi:hypothetical protein
VNPQDPLANLLPLRAPDVIGWWPLAPGWWFLIVAALIALAALTYVGIRYFKRNAYRRRALRQLQDLHTRYQSNSEATLYLGQINSLLKSVALAAYPRREVAAMHGADWECFLGNCVKPVAPFPDGFAMANYVKTSPDIDLAQLYRAALYWIKHHRVTA